MGRFDRRDNNRRGGGSGFDRRPTTMYPAVCDKCGKDCQVPFRPSGDKPVAQASDNPLLYRLILKRAEKENTEIWWQL